MIKVKVRFFFGPKSLFRSHK